MENYEKLTLKEEKIILLPYVIHSINNSHKQYTAKQVLDCYNNVLIRHNYKKISSRTFNGYLQLLKELGIVNAFIKIINKKGSQIYYKLTKNTTECAKFLRNYFIKESLDKFITMRDNYFKSMGVL